MRQTGCSELSADVTEALKKQEKMFKLGMSDYDLSFNENGMLKVSSSIP